MADPFHRPRQKAVEAGRGLPMGTKAGKRQMATYGALSGFWPISAFWEARESARTCRRLKRAAAAVLPPSPLGLVQGAARPTA
ncbi:MAG: hypothetical protein KME20_04435 [Kaiparowitsia implicata GSE-PSE-MK54-09C]|nr:hypothetical protein [Kaiparowitsia implicata GSE-PSE-MK54-09C]